jgi:DNA-binding beta-propeller fold protein YncE
VLPLEGEPHGIAVYGDTLAVTLDKANALAILDRVSLTELRRYPTGDTPHTVAVSPGAIVVTDSRDNSLRQVEPESLTVTSGAMPESIAITAGHAVSADAQGGSVTIARLPGLEGARAVAVGGAPVRVIPFEGESVLVSLQAEGEVARVAIPSGQVTKRVKVAKRPDGLCVPGTGAYVAVASNAEGVLEIFSTVDWKSVSRLNLEDGLGACLWLPAR